ncbi:reverse transcriptase domain-containing protein [Tanacetum coccineum]|uniref:Reverse transcriptase domain-containing protein n=1 Tax=Tanacetum coccineum TaxID=301880 RepID=A0ABQ4XYW8_9ASTR
MELPSLTPPFPKETLYAYLAVSKEAVSSVLLTEIKGKQSLIQYVSRTLNESERNYDPMEKLALSLIHMTRRLRVAYFIFETPDGESPENYFRSLKKIPKREDTEEWEFFTDRASSSKGSDAGLVLIGPSGIEHTYSLRLTFNSTNNVAEYEALLARLRIAGEMGIQKLAAKVDSKLVASQINENYVASSDNMMKYLAKAKEYIASFKSFSIKIIPRNQNQKADVLNKLVSVAFNHLTKEVLVEVLIEWSTKGKEISTIVDEEVDNWMTPIIQCLEKGVWQEDKNETRNLRVKINQYAIENGVLFKKSYLVPMLRCVGPLQANYVIWEIHIGLYGIHSGPRAIIRKAIRQGYYWPTMHEEAKKKTQKCDSCQIHSAVPKLPKTFMTSIMALWPFYQWGMDILRPLPQASRRIKYVIVAINYSPNGLKPIH